VTYIVSPFDQRFYWLFSALYNLVYTLNKKPVVLAVSELFTAVRKYKMYPRDLVFDPCDLVLLS